MQTHAKHHITPGMAGMFLLALTGSTLLWLAAPGWTLLASPLLLLPYAVVVELFHRYKLQKITEDAALLLTACKGWFSRSEWSEVEGLRDFMHHEIPSRIPLFAPPPAEVRAKFERIGILATKARSCNPSPNKLHECREVLHHIQRSHA